MQNTNAKTLPIEFVVRDIFTAMAGTNVADFDEADFAALPAQCQLSAFFAISHGPDDIKQAVDTAWPYPSGTRNVDALVVVRSNRIDIARYNDISSALHCKVPGSLFITVSKCSTLPPGTALIILLAISPGNQTRKPLGQPYLKLVVQDEAQGQPE